MKKFLIALSILLNVVVVAVGAWLYFGGAMSLMFDGLIRPSHERWVSQFAELDVQDGDVVFLGDSITEGGAWHELFPDTPVRNRGIGGDTTAGVLARLDQVIAARPAKVFLLIGTNDLMLGTTEDDIVANIGSMLDRIAAASPETALYVQSILPRAVGFKEQVESLNAALAASLDGRATWIDLYPLLLNSDDGSIDDRFSNDELHLHGAGYVVWRDAIRHLVTTNS